MRKHLGWCASLVLSVAACGGDNDSNGGVVTGLPAEQKLSTLTDADVKKACESVNASASVVIPPASIKRAICVPFGVSAAVTYSGDKATVDINKCQEIVDACVASSDEEDDDDDVTGGAQVDASGGNDCDDAKAQDLAGCEATVGEYESCVNMMLNEAQRKLAELTCQNGEQLSSEEYSYEADLDPADIPQCKTIMTKCPSTQLGLPFSD